MSIDPFLVNSNLVVSGCSDKNEHIAKCQYCIYNIGEVEDGKNPIGCILRQVE